jgi:tetratricopeptide (TPR) repeat protein
LDTAATNWSEGPPSLGRLWQVPVFLLGIVILAAVLLFRPVLASALGFPDRFTRELHSARKILEEPDADVGRAVAKLENLLVNVQQAPEHKSEVHYLLGTALLRTADKLPAPAADEQRRQARTHLEQVEKTELPSEEWPRYGFALGKAWALTGAEPRKIVEALKPAIESAGEEAFPAYGWLAKAYLSLPQPNLEAALEANAKQLQLPTVNETLLGAVRLERGELLMKLHRPAEACDVLKRVRPPAPDALIDRALELRALGLQEQAQWEEAVALWREFQARQVPPAVRARAGYHLGNCLAQLDQTAEAERAWEQSQAAASGDEAPALALRLAETRLASEAPATAVPDFERAVRDIKAPADWHTPLIGLDRVRELFEHGGQVLCQAGQFEASMQLARLYARVALPGVAEHLLAQSAEANAQVRSAALGSLVVEGAWREELEAIRALHRRAADAYEKAASLATRRAQNLEWLWRAGKNYALGEDFPRAAAALAKFLKADESTTHAGEAYYLLGEAFRNLKHADEAEQTYADSLNYRGPFEFMARYELAMVRKGKGKLDEAKELLERNLQLLVSQPESEAHEKTLIALANIDYQRGNLREAAERFEQAITSYPKSTTVVESRQKLADCYRRMAEREFNKIRGNRVTPPDVRSHALEKYREFLGQAADEFQKLAKDLATKQATSGSSSYDEAMFRFATFSEAECRSDRGEYQEAVQIYKLLAVRYHNRVEGLYALSGLYKTYERMDSKDDARKVREQLRSALPETDFSNPPPDSWPREEWENWLGKDLTEKKNK